MKTRTKTIHSAYQGKDAYGALAMPVYHTAAYEFENAEIMADAFCSREQLQDLDISETCIRLSVGLEDMDDVFEDIRQALD